jgi:predicted TIM-barrel fold metal-dependent hydrolase
MGYAAISSDDHLQEPITLFAERLPAKLRAKGPRLVDLPNGGQAFQLGDSQPKPLDLLVSAGLTLEQKRQKIPARWENVKPGFWKAAERLADMDKDGIWATVLYPNMLLDLHMNQVDIEPELKLATFQVYNDHMSEFCKNDPVRLIGYGLIPTRDPQTAVKEMERVAKLGNVKGMLLPVKPDLSDWLDPIWDPVWAAASRLGFILSLHGGKPRGMPTRNELAKMPHGMGIYIHVGYLSVIESFSQIFWSGCFERYPDLKIISVEGDIGWIPHWKERADRVFNKFALDDGFKTHPYEWFGRNFFATFEGDPMGIRLLDVIGEKTLMWASDYPHSNSSFPNSVQHIEKHFGQLPAPTRKKLVWDNCAEVYGIRAPKAH